MLVEPKDQLDALLHRVELEHHRVETHAATDKLASFRDVDERVSLQAAVAQQGPHGLRRSPGP
jgi:hypothetical protein